MYNFRESVAIVGAGKGGSAFLSILIKALDIEITGISDTNPDAPGLEIARQYNIPTTNDFRNLLDKNPDIVINVTGDSSVESQLLKYKAESTEIIDGKSAKLVWNLLKKHQEARDEVKTLLNATKELYRIGISMLSSDKSEDVLDSLLTEACRYLNVPAGSVALYDGQSKLLTLKASHGFSLTFSQVVQWKVRSGGMTDHILSKRVPTIITDVEKNPFIDNKILIEEKIKSLLAIPLYANDLIIGILYLDDFKPRDWTEKEIEFTTLLGIQAAFAIEKFSLIEMISRVSLTDDLTGLYNRRGFLTLAQQQMEIAGRVKQEVMLLFADLDKLKLINDNFGHEKGDMALIDAANVLSQTFRKSDIIARLGGDEFTVLALKTPESDAESIASRLQKNIAAHNQKKERPYRLSLSVGIVLHDPSSPQGIDELLSQVDNIMYKQKQAKTNQAYKQ